MSVLVGRDGTCEIAPYGTALPDDFDDALDAAFVDLGEISEDGLEHVFEVESERIANWAGQTVRLVNKKANATFKMKFLETNEDVVGLFYGAAVTGAAGVSSVAIGDPAPDTRAMVVTVIDGDTEKRYVLAKVQVSDRGSVPEKGDEASTYELTFEALYDSTVGGYGELQFDNDLTS